MTVTPHAHRRGPHGIPIPPAGRHEVGLPSIIQGVRLRPVHTALALLLGVAAIHSHPAATSSQAGSPRIVAIADIHGTLSGLTAILRETGLIDGSGGWTGGNARLVQTGDFFDRGADVRGVMDLLMRLETEARRAGGRVDVLFGNHEGMNLLHDFRDVSAEAYEAFADGRSEDRRRRALEADAAIAKRAGGVLDRDRWMAAHPRGFLEYAEAIGPRGRYGRWLRARNVALQIDDTIFMHAGLAPDSTTSLDEVNRGVQHEIRTWDGLVGTLERQRLVTRTFTLNEIVAAAQEQAGLIVAAQKTGDELGEHVTREFVMQLQQVLALDTWALFAAEGPMWYRGLATLPAEAQPALEQLLARHGAVRFVVGHTPQLPGTITARFDGRVLLADTGMLAAVYRGGRPSAVEILNGRVTAVYPGAREPLPSPAAPRTGVVRHAFANPGMHAAFRPPYR